MTTTSFLEQHLSPRERIGEVALVTGGTQGIGKEVARKLVHAGVTVVLGARNNTVGEAAATELSADGQDGARAVFHRLDLADEHSVADTVAFVNDEFGRLDILVNNAARAFPPKSAFEVTADEMHAVNVSSERGALGDGDTASADRMRRRAGNTAPAGRIAHRIAFVTPPNMTYGTSKAALNAVTQHFAYQLERTGSRVRINAAAPGHCATPFNNFTGWRTAEEGARIIAALALGGDDTPQGAFLNDEGPTVL